MNGITYIEVIDMTKKQKKKSILYLGKETYGDIPKEEAFRKALEPYFNKDKNHIVS